MLQNGANPWKYPAFVRQIQDVLCGTVQNSWSAYCLMRKKEDEMGIYKAL
jgi:hypothetical protein